MQRGKTIRLRYAGLLLLLSTVPQAGAQTATLAGLTDNWFVTSDSVRLHYLSGGSGSTIVFVPGWTMPADIWGPQLRYFARSHRVIALDPRSQGASDRVSEGNFVGRRAQDVHELLHHLGAQHVVLVVWSLGVVEALELVERFGTADIAGLVLVDGLIWVSPNSSAAGFVDSTLVRLLRDRRTFTAAFVRDMYRTHRDPQGAGIGARLCVALTARCCASARASCARRLIPCAQQFRTHRSRSSSTLVTPSSSTSRSALIECWNVLFNGCARARSHISVR